MTTVEERVATLETLQKVDSDRLKRVEAKIDEVHEILTQARGAKYFIVGIAMLIGAVTPKLISWLPLVGGK